MRLLASSIRRASANTHCFRACSHAGPMPDKRSQIRHDINLDNVMRIFLAACAAAVVIAIGVAVVLDGFIQESSTAAFSRPGVRL